MKRFLSLLMAFLMLFSLAACSLGGSAEAVQLPLCGVSPLRALAGARLEYPTEYEYFLDLFVCEVCAEGKTRIKLLAKPKSGAASLGTVPVGTEVEILAERGNFYYFETPDGDGGWNSKSLFKLVWINEGPGSYSETSTRGVRLQRPKASEYIAPRTAYTVSKSDGWIYIMPKPKTGNGNLGILADGTEVTLLAEKDGLYFFETEDDKAGWNGKSFFTAKRPPSPFAPESLTPYGQGYWDHEVNGTYYSDVEIRKLIVDSYYARNEGEGYRSGRSTDNKYGYDFGFYFADDLLYYAEARSGSPLKIQVKLYFGFDGEIIGCRDYRGSDSSLYTAGCTKCSQIAKEFSYVYSLASK